jgi:hypothetical protein
VLFEFIDERGDHFAARTRGLRRAGDRQRAHPILSARREGTPKRTAPLAADEMKALDAERIREAHVVVDNDVERPWKIARHGCRSAKTAPIRPHDAIAAREMRHPRVPGSRALGVTVQKQHGFGLRPRIRKIIDKVVHVEVGAFECRH